MKAYKIEVLVLDFDGLGEQGVRDAIEHQRYANDCISPDVKSMQSRDIEWTDDHPLNRRDTCEAEYRRLFEEVAC
jgi:hypothetical protein